MNHLRMFAENTKESTNKIMLECAVASADSGYGHSGEQIFQWLESWGKDAEKGSPQPDILPIAAFNLPR